MTLQTMIETFSVDHKGSYPKNIQILQKEAKKNKYWRDLINPYTKKNTNFINIQSESMIEQLYFINESAIIAYFVNKERNHYKIFIFDKKGTPLKIREKLIIRNNNYNKNFWLIRYFYIKVRNN